MPRFFRCALIALAVVLVGRLAPAQETTTVTAEGVAAIHRGALDIARRQAIEDAQKRAVEQAIGVVVDSQTRVENDQVISGKILSRSKGYITKYAEIGENEDSGLLRVRIAADVALGKLSNDLAAAGIVMGRRHKPRTMVLVAEQNIGRGVDAWWMGQPAGAGMSVVERAFMDAFAGKGIEFIDHGAASREITVAPAFRVQDLSADQAKTLGRQADADVVIIGRAVARLSGDAGGGMKSVQADLSATAVRTDTGEAIATSTAHAAAMHIAELTAGTEALRKAANQAADDMMTKILAVSSREAGGSRTVAVTISGLTRAQFVTFKDVLRNQVRSITDVHERSFTGSVAKISVDSKSSVRQLAGELVLRDFGAFTVEVVGSTANSLELTAAPK